MYVKKVNVHPFLYQSENFIEKMLVWTFRSVEHIKPNIFTQLHMKTIKEIAVFFRKKANTKKLLIVF